jgi:hypothetical protein
LLVNAACLLEVMRVALALKLVFTQPRLLGFLPRLFGPMKISAGLPHPEPVHSITP